MCCKIDENVLIQRNKSRKKSINKSYKSSNIVVMFLDKSNITGEMKNVAQIKCYNFVKYLLTVSNIFLYNAPREKEQGTGSSYPRKQENGVMLREKLWKPLFYLSSSFLRRQARNISLLLAGVILTGGVLLAVSEFDTYGHNRVHAVNSSYGNAGERSEIQAGLMGVINGVSEMEEYSDATRQIGAVDSKAEVLAGVTAVDRRIIHQTNIQEGARKAKELSYYAQQTVHENQLPWDEYYTLLQIVEAEATGGDVISKMMVAGVVLNRVRDSRFPDSISEVVWQDEQFQPTSDGRIYSCDITDSTIEAVDRVLLGEDYSQGALFFVARTSATAENLNWFDSSLVWLFEYGGHDYYTFQES